MKHVRALTCLLASAATALTLTELPAAAQDASPTRMSASPAPSPTRFACGAPAQYSVTAQPADLRSGESTTVTVVRRLEPCYSDESQSHDVTLYSRPAGSQAEPTVAATGRTDSQGSVTFALSPTVSTEYSDLRSFEPQANGPRVARVGVDEACPRVGNAPTSVGANKTFTVFVFSSKPDTPTTFRITRTIPAPVAVVRRASGIQVPQYFAVPENTRLLVSDDSGTGSDCADVDVVVRVTPSLSIAAVRNGVRNYIFSGRVLPGRGQLVTLYRHDGTKRLITAQTRVQSNGLYRFDRRFSGSGRFGFSVSVGNSPTNLAGSSAVRPTVIH